jgi:hypothetical protein
MYQPINQVRLRGFLTEPARLFPNPHASSSRAPVNHALPFAWKSGSTMRTYHQRNPLVSITSQWSPLEHSFLICYLSWPWTAKSRSQGGSAVAMSIPTGAASSRRL